MKRLIILLLIVGCEETTEPLVCDEGLTELDGKCIYECDEGVTECYYPSDLDVLQDFINNAQDWDIPPNAQPQVPSDLSPIELGKQVWEDGRLVELCITRSPDNEYDNCIVNFSLNQIPPSLGSLDYLRTLILPAMQLNGEIPSSISNLNELKVLDLSHNRLSGDIPIGIWDLDSLSGLYLSDNNLVGKIPENINQLSKLVDLELGVSTVNLPPNYINKLTGHIPNNICALSSLSSLNLNNSGLTGDVPSCLWAMESLRNLNLGNSYSPFFDHFPDEFDGVYNQFDGLLIPHEIGNLQNLEALNLMGLQITGEIPESINYLSNLMILWLNNNQLTILPESICNLSTHCYVIITNNQFCPPYPDCNEALIAQPLLNFVGEQDTTNCP